ncbi:glycosyltransferase [Polynucleobacter asymbioticus]|uniref:glycosyltransferase n=1 Tax=Polynucleobacter asymbioticus TaxID=576611 RepID=UPI0008F91420|nr:glycosyltransferase [Polynucleobacter asymbioticus]
MKKNIFAVIVTFNQDNNLLSELISNLIRCDINLIVVKNSEHKINVVSTNVYEIQNSYNIGLSAALNLGIKYCLKNNAEMIFLFDQDSRIDISSISSLIFEAEKLFNFENNIAAIGPSFVELNTNKIHGFARLKFLKVSSHRSRVNYNEALYLITSGSVLNPKALIQVGLMDENLFIDYIDVDWGMRARNFGYKLIGINSIVMNHMVGDNSINFLGRAVPVHSKFRLYYQTRNSIYMYKKSNVLIIWKISDFIYFLKRSFLYIFIDYKNLKIITKAIIDGLKMK